MESRLAIVDGRVEDSLIKALSVYADAVFPFRSDGVTYNSISCHPDIFIYQDERNIILAPNAPDTIKNHLQEKGIPFKEGYSNIGTTQKDSCFYNCVSTSTLLFHKPGYTDPLILEVNKGKKLIALPQSYTRCSMFAIDDSHFITSDPGIHNILEKEELPNILFSPNEIRIIEHRYGFLGGTCGMVDNKMLFLGNPLRHKDGKRLISFIEENGKECISLGNNFLYDGGGIFFI
ncbi:MAG: DUF6873 family GME fold protein [Paludibacteraceae bacterium]|nr:hypothetical protein [Prevotellaceae bacterium]